MASTAKERRGIRTEQLSDDSLEHLDLDEPLPQREPMNLLCGESVPFWVTGSVASRYSFAALQQMDRAWLNLYEQTRDFLDFRENQRYTNRGAARDKVPRPDDSAVTVFRHVKRRIKSTNPDIPGF